MTSVLGREYPIESGGSLPFYFETPANRPNAPLIVFIHGGGWISGSKDDCIVAASDFLKAGYAVAAIDYRLAPLHPFPAAVDDIRSFLRFARGNGHVLGIDPAKIATLGVSAGGHLSLMAASSIDPQERANAAISLSGLTDLTHYRDQHFPIAFSFISQFLPDEDEAILAQASPAVQVRPDSAPMLVVHGEEDDIVPIAQADRMSMASRSAGVRCDLIKIPGEGHTYSLPAWREIEKAALSFLSEVLR